MNQQIRDILHAAEGRYFNPAEKADLREFTLGLDARLAAMDEIAAKETVIVERTVREVFAAYPDMEKKYKNALQTCMRDTTLVLRYVAQAMVRRDPQYLNDGLLTWLATMLKGVGLAPHFIEDTYKAMGLIANKELSPAAAKLVQPFLAQCTSVLAGKSAATPVTAKEAK